MSKYQCCNSRCQYVTSRKRNLINHLKNIHNVDSGDIPKLLYPPGTITYQCYDCQYVTSGKWNLIRHLKNDHEIDTKDISK